VPDCFLALAGRVPGHIDHDVRVTGCCLNCVVCSPENTCGDILGILGDASGRFGCTLAYDLGRPGFRRSNLQSRFASTTLSLLLLLLGRLLLCPLLGLLALLFGRLAGTTLSLLLLLLGSRLLLRPLLGLLAFLFGRLAGTTLILLLLLLGSRCLLRPLLGLLTLLFGRLTGTTLSLLLLLLGSRCLLRPLLGLLALLFGPCAFLLSRCSLLSTALQLWFSRTSRAVITVMRHVHI